MEAGQEPSDGKVSLFCDSQQIGSLGIPYSFVSERLYNVRGAITCLVTVSIVEESKRLGGNFHNCCGS